MSASVLFSAQAEIIPTSLPGRLGMLFSAQAEIIPTSPATSTPTMALLRSGGDNFPGRLAACATLLRSGGDNSLADLADEPAARLFSAQAEIIPVEDWDCEGDRNPCSSPLRRR